MPELPKAYEPKNYEDEIYKRWEASGFFNPDKLNGEPYSILFPPPNVTGVLHLGHALENSLMDAMTRYQRMKGKKVLLLPGTDHAAVATQAKVEKELIKQGVKKPREELGREELLKKIREYAENSKTTILSQIRRMGTSCDWSRLAYTFDEPRSRAVNEVFTRMYNDDLIYRGYRVVNWSVKGQSTCSDDELVYIERPAKLYTFKYSKEFPFSIATTRPETKLGDTAVAVNPNDKRYKKYIGKVYRADVGAANPLELKIIADENVESDFGTGALGVTPAHSAVDFGIYEKMKASGEPINLIPVIGADGKMNEAAGKNYQGLKAEEAREKFVTWLKDSGLLEKEEDITQSVGTSDRFGDVVEALPMTQWFVDVNKIIPGRGKSLKDLMKEAVSTGHNGDPAQKIKITPDRFEKIYYNWIDNLRDWCISRQIWWGHRIPVWYKKFESNSSKPIVKQNVDITYFVHGTSVENEQGIASGHSDTPLSERGKKETEKLKDLVKEKFDVVFCSDLPRAVETARIVFGQNIIKDNRLREADYGELTGREGKDVYPLKLNKITEKFSGGESYKDVESRMKSFLSDVMDKYAGKKVAIVAHQGPQLAMDVIVKNKTWAQAIAEDWRNTKAWQPGWKYELKELTYVGGEVPAGEGWKQDPDTLDTWFSSGLWTFSTLGWPEKTEDFKLFHPVSWMQMGYEILFFWMARMILMTTYTIDQIPFRNVYIHGMARDEHGKKFSKSAGTGVDPVDMINIYGCDALRLSLLSGVTPGNDTRFYDEKIEGWRNFVNKFWNISRYILSQDGQKKAAETPTAKTLADQWILDSLESLKEEVANLMDSYDFSLAIEKLREYTWSDFADWYLEIAKIETGKMDILNYVLNTLLVLWHPFMPFVTEVIWKEIYGDGRMLMIEKWPVSVRLGRTAPGKSSTDFALIKNIIVGIRAARSDNKIEPAKKMNVAIGAGDKKVLLEDNQKIITGLARLENLSIESHAEKPANSVGFVAGNVEVFLDLAGVVDLEKERTRLGEELKSAEKFVTGLEGRLANAEFVQNAPPAVVEKERVKLSEAKEKMTKIQNQLSGL